MKAYKKGKKLMIQHNVFLGFAVFTTFLSFLAFVSLRDEDPLAPFFIAGIAVIFWVGFFITNRKIDDQFKKADDANRIIRFSVNLIHSMIEYRR